MLRHLHLTIFFLVYVSTVSAQLQLEYGKELLEPESAATDTSELSIDYQASNVFNDHMEFGLSIDPNTSSLAGRDESQLQGVVNLAGVNLQGILPLGKRFGLKLQYNPLFENYIGENGQLNEFDAFTDLFLTELSFRPSDQLPALTLSHQLQRLDRKDDTYDSLHRQIAIRFGKLLEYNLRLGRFDDDQTLREDFLLIGSNSHRGVARFQLGILKGLLGKFEYSIEREDYQDNLNNLVLGVAGIQEGESRLDVRHFISTKLLEVAGSRFIFQQEFNLFLNGSNVDFYDFSSAEVAAGTFYKINAESWARLRLAYLAVGFGGRRTRDDAGFRTDVERKDQQVGLNFRLNWQLRDKLTLFADYQLTKNNTNEENEIFDFLDYTNNIVSVTIQANY